jgi:hypothetical protein
LKAGKEAEFILFDLLGNVILKQVLSSSVNRIVIKLPNLSKGVYLYRYNINGENQFVGKLIKE